MRRLVALSALLVVALVASATAQVQPPIGDACLRDIGPNEPYTDLDPWPVVVGPNVGDQTFFTDYREWQILRNANYGGGGGVIEATASGFYWRKADGVHDCSPLWNWVEKLVYGQHDNVAFTQVPPNAERARVTYNNGWLTGSGGNKSCYWGTLFEAHVDIACPNVLACVPSSCFAIDDGTPTTRPTPGPLSTWCCRPSPILVDTAGDGFAMTDAAGGVWFDIGADGTTEKVSWTTAASNDMWLALDRNANGKIDDGKELFGNVTPQDDDPVWTPPVTNGFNALKRLDTAAYGGNGDGWISSADSAYAALRLWKDANHNGVSTSTELYTLSSQGIAKLSVGYEEHYWWDANANFYWIRGIVLNSAGAQNGKWAFDVYLTKA